MAYRQVYWRIRSAYEWGQGFQSETQREIFRQEVKQLFSSDGWEVHKGQSSAYSDTATKGQQELYLHPMTFSGVIDEATIPCIEALLSKARTFRHCGTDCYDVYEEMSDADYWAYLDAKRDEITAAILKRYQTKRRNLYITGISALTIAEEFTVKRLCDKEGHRNKANLLVDEIIEQLIRDGKLITAQTKNGLGIRTAIKADKQRP